MAAKTDRDVKQEVEQRVQEIALLKEEAQQQGLAFSSPSEEELARKIKGESSASPYIYAQSWTSGTSFGSPASYTVYVANPDPSGHYPIFATIFFGAVNFLNDIGEGLSGRDTRWPYMSSAPFSLAAGATSNKAFSYTTPTGIPASTYPANSVIWGGQYHDKGTYFDRGLFYVTLS